MAIVNQITTVVYGINFVCIVSNYLSRFCRQNIPKHHSFWDDRQNSTLTKTFYNITHLYEGVNKERKISHEMLPYIRMELNIHRQLTVPDTIINSGNFRQASKVTQLNVAFC